MFVLRVTAQGSSDDTDLTPNNGLIRKVYKPKGWTKQVFSSALYTLQKQ